MIIFLTRLDQVKQKQMYFNIFQCFYFKKNVLQQISKMYYITLNSRLKFLHLHT